MLQFNARPLAVRVAVFTLALGVTAPLNPDFPSSGRVEAAAMPAGASSAADGYAAAAGAVAKAGSLFDASTWTAAVLGGIDTDVFALALRAAEAAIHRGDVSGPSTLTVIDFSRSSKLKRLWVYDLRSKELLFHELVSHGRNSGDDLATSFSNVAESNKSSIGLFRTAETYIGKHGYSLRLDGLEKGINDNARARAIVMHGADYVSAGTAKALGRLGRSLGCPAVGTAISRSLIDAVKDGGLLFAYAPQQRWIASSTYLN
jgi:hypothetical protein